MNRNSAVSRRPAGAIAVAALAAGLVLAGCGGSSGGSASSNNTAASGSGSTPASSAASSSSGSGSGGSVTTSDTVPFPVGVGNTWTYKTTYGTTVNRQTAVSSVSGGQQVTMVTTSTVNGSTTHNTAYYVVHPDGSISLPFSQFNTSTSGTTVKLISGNVFWPPAAQLASGQASHDTLKIEFSAGGVQKKVTAHITVKGVGTQSVTVPAGTYSATVIEMRESETIEGIAVSSVVKTWLASGVGPVQTEVLIDEGGSDHLAAQDQLVSFKAG